MKSIILIFIALGCGLVASIGISQVMNGGGGSGNMEMDQVLVALSDIDIGSKLDAQNVKLEDWPKAKIPDGAVRRLEDVKDKFANARFFKGEPLHVNKISDTLSNIANKVPPGYRAMPVVVAEDTVMKGISPGDRVDVMVFLKKNGIEISETGCFTILKNVRVFAVNTNTERASDAKGESNFKTISLLVKPDHSRELVVASQMGKIMLTLRRPDENDELTGEEVTPLSDILSGRSKQGSDPASTAAPAPPTFLGLVQDSANSGTLTTTVPSILEPVWTMDILTPTERKRFEWTDHKQPPTETSFGTPGTSPAPAPAPTSGKAPKTTDKDKADKDKSDKGASSDTDDSNLTSDKDAK
jgi:pilus assembly protein CpaB